jgi:hypothetical protein
MSDSTATMGAKDIISPTIGKYTMTQSWIFAPNSTVPIGVQMAYDFSDSTINGNFDPAIIPTTAGTPQLIAVTPIPNKFL